MTDGAGPREFAVYVAGLAGLGTAAIGTFYVLFTSGYPRFISSVLDDPGQAVSNDPASLVLLVASVALVVLLVAFVVAFGVKHGPDPEASPPEDADERA